MNGAPFPPPDPTGPPGGFLFVIFLAGFLLVAGCLFVASALEKRQQKREDQAEVLAETLARENENLENYRIQVLINQSPGGRKPWQ